MSNEELGKALTKARIARGLTLRDVERDTRISSKYLEALENGTLDLLPAPVYARAFMRTYAQYLGLNAPAFVQRLPGAKPEPELPPLPEVGRGATEPAISASWLVAGGVVVLLLVIGVVFFWNSGGGGGEQVTTSPTPAGAGAEQLPLGDQQPVAPVAEVGIVPDVESYGVLIAIAALAEAELPYLIIELEIDTVPAGTVFQQSPSPGTAADDDTVVTLLVSR